MKIREKRIYSGKILEAEFYPVTSDGRRYSRGTKKKQSKASQKKLNDKNAKKKIRRLMETNFTEGQDYYCTFTYHDKEQPESYEACKKDLTNFFRRLRRAREKAGLTELKYARKSGAARAEIHLCNRMQENQSNRLCPLSYPHGSQWRLAAPSDQGALGQGFKKKCGGAASG